MEMAWHVKKLDAVSIHSEHSICIYPNNIFIFVYSLLTMYINSYKQQSPCDSSFFLHSCWVFGSWQPNPDHNASVTQNADSIYSHFPVSGYQGHKKDQISPVASVSEH